MDKKLYNAISNDVYGEGQTENCRWMYSPTDNPRACGILSLATADIFDRWANSRIIEISTVLWENGDPDFVKFIDGAINLFNSEDSKNSENSKNSE